MGRLNANVMPLYKQNQSTEDMKRQLLYVGFFVSAGLYSYFYLFNKKEMLYRYSLEDLAFGT